MSALLASLLLVCALVLPFVAALALRTFRERLTSVQGYGIGVTVLLLAFASVLALARSEIDRLQIGNLTLLLPISGAVDTLPAPPEPTPRSPADLPPPAAATPPPATATLSPTLEPTAPPTATPEPPTATPEPPTATPEPPTATPEPQAARRTYRVQSGDTLRSIAEQFNVSVQDLLRVNNLTPEQADALRVGAELIIP